MKSTRLRLILCYISWLHCLHYDPKFHPATYTNIMSNLSKHITTTIRFWSQYQTPGPYPKGWESGSETIVSKHCIAWWRSVQIHTQHLFLVPCHKHFWITPWRRCVTNLQYHTRSLGVSSVAVMVSLSPLVTSLHFTASFLHTLCVKKRLWNWVRCDMYTHESMLSTLTWKHVFSSWKFDNILKRCFYMFRAI